MPRNPMSTNETTLRLYERGKPPNCEEGKWAQAQLEPGTQKLPGHTLSVSVSLCLSFLCLSNSAMRKDLWPMTTPEPPNPQPCSQY